MPQRNARAVGMATESVCSLSESCSEAMPSSGRRAQLAALVNTSRNGAPKLEGNNAPRTRSGRRPPEGRRCWDVRLRWIRFFYSWPWVHLTPWLSRRGPSRARLTTREVPSNLPTNGAASAWAAS